MTAILTPLASDYLFPIRNRTVMSAMTRGFAAPDHSATVDIMEYYRRRAAGGVGLILTEGVVIDPSGDGYNSVPHIANDQQAESWRKVTDAVHEEGAAIACQLWHCGRISHSDYTGGQAPVSSTNRPAEGVNRQNDKPYGTPRALEVQEIPGVCDSYTRAAKRALAAGFDAVELHLGHGYLVDQFLDARINDRTDAYGGSVENRCRFALELVRKVVSEVSSERVIVRISPSRFMNGLYDWPDLNEMLDYIIPELWNSGLRTLDVSCANADYFQTSGRIVRMIRKSWNGLIMGGASLTKAQAEAELDAGLLDMVTWGRAFIANPDLPKKIENDTPWIPFANEMRDTLI